MTSYKSLALLLCAGLLTACGESPVRDITGPMASARIKFFNFGVSAPDVNFYANETKVTAISSTTGKENTTGVKYGEAGAGGYYSALAPGQYTLAGKISAATDKDLAISSVATTIADGKSYSFYQSGIYNAATKTIDAFVVEDAYPAEMDYTTAYVRFVNTIGNSNPMTLYVISPKDSSATAVGGTVAYKSAGAFTKVAPGSYNLGAREAASSTDRIAAQGKSGAGAVTFAAGRVYTVSARGDMTVIDAKSAKYPILESWATR